MKLNAFIKKLDDKKILKKPALFAVKGGNGEGSGSITVDLTGG